MKTPGATDGSAEVRPGAPWAALHETHSGVVLLMGRTAYKFKKPVDLGFLDFTTLAARRRACLREVELNRRVAPDVYEGVGELAGPDGATVEPVVMMRRMPEDRRLATLVRSGADVDVEVREVARRLATFHAAADRGVVGADSVTAESLEALWRSSFDAMAAPTGGVVAADVEAEIERLVRRFLAGRSALLERRRSTGSVLDGHGDLIAQDIFCLRDGPRILDCLEFDDDLRVVDQVDDAAFLAMDLEHLGARELGSRFLAWYSEFSGDNAPESLVQHYVAYRAFVRAKVACVRHGQGHSPAAAEARELTDLALDHLERAAVRLVVLGGPPGTGKSTTAAGVADELGMTVLSSDRVRKELAGLSPLGSAAAPTGRGIYSESWTRHVYEELMRRVALLLGLGESVVLDATWSQRWQRELARATARSSHADLLELCCQLPPEQADLRVRSRRAEGSSAAGTVSDADTRVAASVRDRFEVWPEAQVLDTSAAPGSVVDSAVRLLCRPGPRNADGATAHTGAEVHS